MTIGLIHKTKNNFICIFFCILISNFASASSSTALSTTTGQSNALDIDVSAGQAWASLEGGDFQRNRLYSWRKQSGVFLLNRINLYTNYLFSKNFSIGPDLLYSRSQQQAHLFDRYAAIALGINAKIQIQAGDFVTFSRMHISVLSSFHAERELNFFTINETTKPDDLQFSSTDENVKIESTDLVPLLQKSNSTYVLEGSTPGYELSVGSQYLWNENISILVELGYSSRTLYINNVSRYTHNGSCSYSLGSSSNITTETDENKIMLATKGSKNHDINSVLMNVGFNIVL